jgi:hypothetical protein
VAAAQSRNGTSLKTSIAIRPKPKLSCEVAICGGCSKPVSQGDNARNIQPLGAIKNTKPTANAACGTANKKPKRRTSASHHGLPNACEINQAVKPHANKVEARPVHSVMLIALPICGALKSSFQASKLVLAITEYAQTAIKKIAIGKANRLVAILVLLSLGNNAIPIKPRSGAAIPSQSDRPNCHGVQG